MTEMAHVKVFNPATDEETPFEALGDALDFAKKEAAKAGGQRLGVYMLHRTVASTVEVAVQDVVVASALPRLAPERPGIGAH